MIGHDRLKTLVKSSSLSPCISLIVPLTHKIPERTQNTVLLNKLVQDALEQTSRINTNDARESEKRLKNLIATFDINQFSSYGLAILINSQHSEIIELNVPCTTYSSVGTLFALSEIIQSMQTIQRYWVLLVGKKYARLFLHDTAKLTEIVTPLKDSAGQPLQGFPLNSLPPEDKVKAAVGSGDRGADYIDAEIKHFFQLVDSELNKVMTSQEKLPVILCGTPEYVKLFKTTSHHKEIFLLDMPHDYSAHHNINTQLTTDLKTALQTYNTAQEKQLLNTFEDALNHNRQACGMIRVWETVSAGRVQTLLLEPHLPEVGRINPDNPANLQVFPEKSDITINRIADLLIYETLQHNGTIQIVQSGNLKACKGIAAILRY